MEEFIKDFTALLIISDFDTFLFLTLKQEILKEVLTDETFKQAALTIWRTTSSQIFRSKDETVGKAAEALANKNLLEQDQLLERIERAKKNYENVEKLKQKEKAEVEKIEKIRNKLEEAKK